MGTVLEFRRRAEDDRQRPVVDRDETAEVVIFPGIRVEYHTVDLSHRVMAMPAHDADPLRR